jgi:hypothetical protein
LATAITVPHRSQRWVTVLAVEVVCMATWQTGQGLGGLIFDDGLMVAEYRPSHEARSTTDVYVMPPGTSDV